MTEADRLLADCAANPDDDAPRLVWADHVGGDRGELVVIQCALARGDLDVETMLRYRRRARELLAAHGTAWAGTVAEVARQWRFRRGFVESVEIDLREASSGTSLEAHPLISTVALLGLDATSWRGIPALATPPRGLTVDTVAGTVAILARLGWLDEPTRLRALGLHDLAPANLDDFRPLLTAGLEQLALFDPDLDAATLASMLARTPQLAGLVVNRGYSEPEAQFEVAPIVGLPLRSLVIDVADPDLPALATLPLDRLAIRGARDRDAAIAMLQGFARSRTLHTLEIAGYDPESMLDALALVQLDSLRVLRVPHGDDRMLDGVVERYGRQLVEVVAGGARSAFDYDRAPNVVAADSFSDDGQCCAWSPPVWFVRSDAAPAIFELPSRPAHHDIFFGHGRGDIDLPRGKQNRRHTRLRWRRDAFVVQDLLGNDGIKRNGMLEVECMLADGDTLQIDEVVLRYFVGPGAADRARAALRDLA